MWDDIYGIVNSGRKIRVKAVEHRSLFKTAAGLAGPPGKAGRDYVLRLQYTVQLISLYSSPKSSDTAEHSVIEPSCK